MKPNYKRTKIKTQLLFFALASVFVFSSIYTKAQSWTWAQNLGGTGTEKITDVITDAAGNTYVCGSHTAAFTIGSYSIAAPTGSNSVGCFVAKFNSSGVAQWVHTPVYGTFTNLNPTTITSDAAGNIYYGGISQGAGVSATFAAGNANTVLTSANGLDGFIVKLNSNGVAQWAMGLGYSGAGSVNQMALHLDRFTGYLFFGVSAATNSTAQPQFQNFNYRAPGSSTNVSMGTASATGFQEAWYGRIDVAAGAMMENYRFGGTNNATGKEWIEAIRTNSQNGDVYLATTIVNSPTLSYNGGAQGINGAGVAVGNIIKLDANLVYQGQSGIIGSTANTNKLRHFALKGNTEMAFLIDVSTTSNNPSVGIGGYNMSFGSAWYNAVTSSAGSGYALSGKGICFDASGSLWATVGGSATANFPWSFQPSYAAAAATGSLQTNPGLMLLQLNYTSGSNAAWSSFSYIHESTSNSNSQGSSIQSGKLATAGNAVYLAGGFTNALTPPGLSALTPTGTNAYLMKFGCEPSFTTQPFNKLICGTDPQTIMLATVATGAGNTYQWQKNGVNINSATNDTLILVNPTIADTGTYTLIATNSCGSTTSNGAVITFSSQPVITVQPTAGTVCNGSTVTLSVTATGNVTGYAWMRNGGTLGTNSTFSGATTATLQISGINTSLAGMYSVNVNGNPNCPAVSSNNVTFAIATAPVITADPIDKSLCEGTNASIVSATVSGTSPIFQWFRGGTAVSGATASVYGSTSVSMNDAGVYYLSAGNQCGTVTSQQAIIDVVPVPQITSTFSNQSNCQGINITFSAIDNSAGGSHLYNYRWFKDNVNIGNGSTSSQYVPGVLSSSGTYYMIASNACGADTSNSFVYTVNPATSINTQPVSQSVCNGSPTSFTVSAQGTNLIFQWKKGGNNIANATNATYTIPSVSANDSGLYTVEVNGDCGTATSNAASLTVATAASISVQPISDTICSGDTIRLSVTGAAGNNTTYQWRKGGVNIAYTSATISIPDAQTFDGGAFDVVITGSCGTVTSSVANILVNQSTIITSQPVGGSICAGQGITLPAAVAGTNLSYQWQHNGANINGATQLTYNIPVVSLADSGTYNLLVSGTCGNVSSNVVHLEVKPTPVVNQQPQAQAVCPGTSATFNVSVAGTNTTYQWRFNGQAINGATGNSYTIPTVSASDAGDYAVVILDACLAFVSNNATLTVNPATSIIMQPAAQTTCLGSSISLMTIAGGDNLTYQWQFNGSDMQGANTSTLDLNNIIASQLGDYTAVVTGTCGTATSNIAAVSISTPVSITTQPTTSATEVCAGSTVTLSVAVTGDNALIQWKDNGTNLFDANGTTLVLAPGVGEHYLHVSVAGTCSSVVSDSVLVTVHALPQPTVSAAGFDLSTQAYTAYQWQLEGSDISGATAQNYTAAANGNYSVFVIDANGCSANSPAVNITGLGIDEAFAHSVLVYPNPTVNTLNLKCAEAGNITIQVLTIEGKLLSVFETEMPNTTINVGNLAQGTYILSISQNGKQAFTRFVKK